MDSTVIQEIANQLGMAVDQAGQFVTEQLPAYAGLKVVQEVVPLVIVGSLFLLFAVVSLVSLAVCARAIRKVRKDGNPTSWLYYDAYSCYMSFYVFCTAGITALFFLFFVVMLLCFDLSDVIGWSNYPEAMLIDMALKAVG